MWHDVGCEFVEVRLLGRNQENDFVSPIWKWNMVVYLKGSYYWRDTISVP